MSNSSYNNSTLFCQINEIQRVIKKQSKHVGTIKTKEKSFFGLNKHTVYFVEYCNGDKGENYNSIQSLLSTFNDDRYHQYIINNNDELFETYSVTVVASNYNYHSYFETEEEADEYINSLPIEKMNKLTYKY